MSCIKESVLHAMSSLPNIYTYTGSDGAEHPKDLNLKNIPNNIKSIFYLLLYLLSCFSHYLIHPLSSH
jgi:hypothetical protein